MIKVASGGGNAHSLHINSAVIHNASLRAEMHHGGRQYCGELVSIISIGSVRMIVFIIVIMHDHDHDVFSITMVIIFIIDHFHNF